MQYLIYISTAVRPMGREDLVEILTKSRDNNQRNKITGLLLYAEGTFIQVLEGSQDDVLSTFHNITLDIRHKNVIKLLNDTLHERVFPKWSMGFAALSPGKLKELEGYINPESKMFNTSVSHPAIAVMKSFAENNRLLQNL